jgi:MFS family permease
VTVGGTDTAMTAVMTSWGAVGHLGLVFAIWCLASLAGGFVVGAMARRPSPLVILVLLAVLALPVALAGSWPVLALAIVPTGLFCAPLMASTAEVLTTSTPARVRGLVLGLHSSALTLGGAVGAPLTGAVVDAFGARSGFVAVGAAGLVIAGAALLVARSGSRGAARPGGGEPAPAASSAAVPGVDDREPAAALA